MASPSRERVSLILCFRCLGRKLDGKELLRSFGGTFGKCFFSKSFLVERIRQVEMLRFKC